MAAAAQEPVMSRLGVRWSPGERTRDRPDRWPRGVADRARGDRGWALGTAPDARPARGQGGSAGIADGGAGRTTFAGGTDQPVRRAGPALPARAAGDTRSCALR